ncbi:hypothetical protein SKAU_G00301040 [Synaphobranchus kaupii]|uniref:Secreted protein n=1 Tax=Synaphobranchus kaupii TaxID=118154 RepID=A0A9Q1INA7_SYNKA|nr:hypothetical protein SKAU_G00301040 [Synaphobranchus kaupii]
MTGRGKKWAGLFCCGTGSLTFIVSADSWFSAQTPLCLCESDTPIRVLQYSQDAAAGQESIGPLWKCDTINEAPGGRAQCVKTEQLQTGGAG